MQAEAIYKGATRPAMKFGVPLVPLIVLCGAGALLCLWGGLFISGWVAAAVLALLVPVFWWMRLVTLRDDQRFRQMVMAARLAALDRNARFWQARSYSPTTFKGASDAWRS